MLSSMVEGKAVRLQNKTNFIASNIQFDEQVGEEEKGRRRGGWTKRSRGSQRTIQLGRKSPKLLN